MLSFHYVPRTIYKNSIAHEGETLKCIDGIDWSAIEHLRYTNTTP